MQRVKVDTNGYEYFRFLSVEPKMKYEDGEKTGEQETNAEGIPIYVYTLLAKEQGAGKPETITVKAPSQKTPSLQEFAAVGFHNLVAFAWASNNRANLSFSADAVGALK